jgi:uncharacterized membrane protein YeaQ/YmgE (transglycosylase-associated protein family)
MAALRKFALPLALLAAGCLPAFAQNYSHESSLPGFDGLIHLMGYDGMEADQRDLMAMMMVVFGLGFGYFSNQGFRDSGFGILLNGLVGLAGTSLALCLLGPKYNLLSQVQGRSHDFLLAVLVAGAAVPSLMLAVTLANIRRRATINFFYARSRRKMNAERAALVEAELPPRIAEMLKK